MTIEVFIHFGLILRRNARTRRLARQLVDGSLCQLRDDSLIAHSGGWFREDLDRKIREFESLGLVRGRDFIATAGQNDLFDPVPPWLSSELGPSGNPPELEAKMDPEVREMWQRNRKMQYFITPGYEEDDDG